MLPNESREEKIRRIKDQIADHKDYINSDFCKKCIEAHENIKFLQEELDNLMSHE
jgi:hypothetical protein